MSVLFITVGFIALMSSAFVLGIGLINRKSHLIKLGNLTLLTIIVISIIVLPGVLLYFKK